MVDKFEKALIYGICAPIIADPRWQNIPKELKELAFIQRLGNSLKCVEEEKATEFDALIYLHTASLSVPFSERWFRIYVYLFRKYFPEHAKVIELPEVKLTELEKEELDRLRSWIYKQQIKYLRERKLLK